MLKRAVLIILLAGVAIFFISKSGAFLVVDAPAHADTLLVLGGDNDDTRFWRAAELLHAGYANRIMLDSDARSKNLGETEADRAPAFIVRTLPGQVNICPITADSTYEEAADLKSCLERTNTQSILIVTSAFHTRRALSILSKRLPQYRWSVTLADSAYLYGDQWWKHRRWAKTALDEWEKFLWWKLVEQWQPGTVLH